VRVRDWIREQKLAHRHARKPAVRLQRGIDAVAALRQARDERQAAPEARVPELRKAPIRS